MGNVVVLTIIIIIVSLSVRKIISEKRKGVKCIGCPHGKNCTNSNNCGITLKK